LLKIISGGQTGVDRGALDAALDLGMECGGWCPAGRLAEDGRIPERYPVRETPTAEYAARTRRNVTESDGTLIIASGELSGGTAETLEFCREEGKSHLVINTQTVATNDAVALIQEFIADNRIEVLNVAGPRASQWPDGYKHSRKIASAVLGRLSGHEGADE
jgi:Circularly permutated YpsA SLOG family